MERNPVFSEDLKQAAVKMERSAELLKDEIKANFKGTRKYGKLLSGVAKIKYRSAAWVRKVDRDSGAQLKLRDIEKIFRISPRSWELNTILQSNSQNLGKVGLF